MKKRALGEIQKLFGRMGLYGENDPHLYTKKCINKDKNKKKYGQFCIRGTLKFGRLS